MSASTSFAHRNLPRLLLEAREAVMLHTRPSLRAHGLSDQQWRVLRVLGEHAHERGGIETGRVASEAYLLGPSLTVPFGNGKLLTGEWQQVVLIDFDTSPRRRTIVATVIV